VALHDTSTGALVTLGELIERVVAILGALTERIDFKAQPIVVVVVIDRGVCLGFVRADGR
jgi:hypothetical protein